MFYKVVTTLSQPCAVYAYGHTLSYDHVYTLLCTHTHAHMHMHLQWADATWAECHHGTHREWEDNVSFSLFPSSFLTLLPLHTFLARFSQHVLVLTYATSVLFRVLLPTLCMYPAVGYKCELLYSELYSTGKFSNRGFSYSVKVGQI